MTLQSQLPLDLEAARTRGDLGVERAARRAEKLTPGWVERAADLIKTGACILAARQTDFTIEEVRALVDAALPKPPDLRAWGAATRRAVTLGYIARVPGTYRPAASSNGSPKPVYRKGPNA